VRFLWVVASSVVHNRATAELQECGSPLRSATEADLRDFDPDREGVVPPASKSPDVTGVFGLFVLLPLLLPAVGIKVGALAFGVPFILIAFGAVRAAKAASRARSRRPLWALLTGGAALAALSSVLMIVTTITGSFTLAGFYLGFAASVALLAAMYAFARSTVKAVRLERSVDAALLLLLVVALSVYFVAIPGFGHGDLVLTLVFVVDLAALVFATVGASMRRTSRHRRLGWGLVGVCGAATLGDGFVTATASGDVHISTSLTALMWAIAGFGVAYSADEEDPEVDREVEPAESMGKGWVLLRVVFPLIVVLAFPGVAVPLAASGHLVAWSAGYYATCFVIALVIAFGRQAYLLIDNRLAVARERRLREEAVRRNEQLEALTGLATTMTQTLEETPIVERALDVLRSAARASSSAVHTLEGSASTLRASSGDWYTEHAWADRSLAAPAEFSVDVRGGRQILTLPLTARDNTLGVVTLLRSVDDVYTDDELEILGLLAGELAVAIQNARDYREKLEQAIRDPLTGLYNRRFFNETLDKEIHRADRFGTPVSIVLFDIDNFKDVNDTCGHAVGDDALRKVGAVVEKLIRPVDSVARIGGEEFALLLPQTAQLDALLIAERIRNAIGREPILAQRRITVSAGVASCPEDATEHDELHRKADAALYWCKRNGKDMCAVATEAAADLGDDLSTSLSHLYGLVEMIDARHLHMRDHSQTVAKYAMAIGRAFGMSPEQLLKLRRAALLHDVGKVGVPSDILNKPGPLTEAEFEIVRRHSPLGGLMLAHAGLRDESRWVRWHHERVDGRGYPDRLAGDDIPLEARIIFVADSFEAMTSDRPYSLGMDSDSALAELERHAGSQFDAEVVAKLAALVRASELDILALRDEEIRAGIPRRFSAAG
jgi:diguanylate cyclase (GGDEF)-like protein